MTHDPIRRAGILPAFRILKQPPRRASHATNPHDDGISGIACVLSTFAPAQDQKAAAPAVQITTTKVTITVTPAGADEEKAAPADEKATPTDKAKAIEKKAHDALDKVAAAKAAKEKEKLAEEEKALAPFIQQFLPQLKPLLKSEVHLVKVVCKPSKEQLAKIEKDGDAVIQEAARGIAKAQQNMMQGRWHGNTSNPDPRALLQAGMLKSVARTSPQSRKPCTRRNSTAGPTIASRPPSATSSRRWTSTSSSPRTSATSSRPRSLELGR